MFIRLFYAIHSTLSSIKTACLEVADVSTMSGHIKVAMKQSETELPLQIYLQLVVRHQGEQPWTWPQKGDVPLVGGRLLVGYGFGDGLCVGL